MTHDKKYNKHTEYNIMTLVMKFGGTSVGSAQAMRETAVLIQQAQQTWGQVVVVASGMGSKPVKVTDLLLNGAHTAVAGDDKTYKGYAEQLRQIHYEAIDGLLNPEGERQTIMAEIDQFVRQYERLCQAICVLAELTPRALDALGGMGEQMSVRSHRRHRTGSHRRQFPLRQPVHGFNRGQGDGPLATAARSRRDPYRYRLHRCDRDRHDDHTGARRLRFQRRYLGPIAPRG